MSLNYLQFSPKYSTFFIIILRITFARLFILIITLIDSQYITFVSELTIISL